MSKELVASFPCGCEIWVEKTGSESALILNACSKDCEVVNYIRNETIKQKKTYIEIDRRKDSSGHGG